MSRDSSYFHSSSQAGKGLFIGVFLLVLVGLVVTSIINKGGSSPVPTDSATNPSRAGSVVQGWRGPAALEAEGFTLRLTPLHGDAARQEFDSRALANKLGLPPGSPYRLQVQYDEQFDASPDFGDVKSLMAVQSEDLIVRGDQGEMAKALLQLATKSVSSLEALFKAPESLASADRQVVLWGDLSAISTGITLEGAGFSLSLSSARYDSHKLPQHVSLLHPAAKESQ